MILSRASEYAIRALVHMAEKGGDQPVQLKDISDAEKIPFHFLAKTMQVLTRIRLVRSFRGPRGGFTLMKPASQVYLYEIVNAFDAISQWDSTCILGINPCDDQVVCPIHDDWKPIKEEIFRMFRETTLLELAGKLKEKRVKLAELGLIA